MNTCPNYVSFLGKIRLDNRKLSILLVITATIILFQSSDSNQAYAHTYSPSKCNPCIDFDNSQYPNNSYFMDHGMSIVITYDASTPPSSNQNSVTVLLTSSSGGSLQPLTFSRVVGTNQYTLTTSWIYLTCPGSQNLPSICVNRSSPDNIQAKVFDGSGILLQTNDTDTQSSEYGTLPAAGPQPDLTIIPTCARNWSGDGICDEWKISSSTFNGLSIPYKSATFQWACSPTNPDPLNPCPIPGTSNTNPGTKDVYVELDYLTGQKPDINALIDVVNKFKDNGIQLHIQLDEDTHYHRDLISPPSNGNAGNTDFDNVKKIFFGTSCDRNLTSCPTYNSALTSTNISDLLTAKRFAFHYALFTHSQSGGSSGTSETPGNDIDVSLGGFAGGVGSKFQQEGTFMHELGHNLGLLHGGGDSINCKPNYPSVMSYTFQMPTYTGSWWRLDYSHGWLAGLWESSLYELGGLGSENNQPVNSEVLTFWYTGNPNTGYYNSLTGRAIDWNHNNLWADRDEPDPSIDLDNLGITDCSSAPLVLLLDRSDWYYTEINMWNPYWTTSSMQDGMLGGQK